MQRNTKQTKKYIAGAGLSGLIWKFYHPEFQIVSPEIGGLVKSHPMFWLHDTVETRKLLTDLGWKNPERLQHKSYMGYYHQGWIYDYISPDINLTLIRKKMIGWDKQIDNTYIPKSTDLSLSTVGGSNYMNTLSVDPLDIIKRLSNAGVIEGKITKVEPERITVTQQDGLTKILGYDMLVSSIPAPIFWNIYDEPKEFESLPITNIITKQKPKLFDDRYELVYYDDSVPMSRISHIGDFYSYEFTGTITKGQFLELFPSVDIIDYSVVKYGRIFNQDNKPPKNVIFTGRFAKWDYKITSEHIIKQIIDYKQK